MVYLRLLAIILWTLFCVPIGIIMRLAGLYGMKRWMTRFYFRGMAWIFRLRIEVEGELAKERPLLLVTNHTSYLDIIGLGAVTDVRFTPKMEIRNWPVIGFLCRLIDCVFIERRASRTQANRTGLEEALAEGSVVCLFPEGTTNDGNRVLPFKSSFFSLAEKAVVQPASISYRRLHNLPLTSENMPKIAWYGDMELVPHLFDYLRLGPVLQKITFCPKIENVNGRKELAVECQSLIRKSMR